MKIAFYTNAKQLSGLAKASYGTYRRRNNSLTMDYFSMEERLLYTLELHYRIVNSSKEDTFCLENIKQLKPKKRKRVRKTKYVAFFNGQTCVWDTQDILFLESYYRKASVVMVKGRYRIRVRLDEEEKKLPKEQFIRINRHTIINMRHIKNVRGKRIEIQNGEVFYVNDGRKKKFEETYQRFLAENSMSL